MKLRAVFAYHILTGHQQHPLPGSGSSASAALCTTIHCDAVHEHGKAAQRFRCLYVHDLALTQHTTSCNGCCNAFTALAGPCQTFAWTVTPV
jgi:hypothetical protein